MIVVTKQGDIKELGKPIKETDNKLFFQLGSVWKHSINHYHYSQTLFNFRRIIADKKFNEVKIKSILKP